MRQSFANTNYQSFEYRVQTDVAVFINSNLMEQSANCHTKFCASMITVLLTVQLDLKTAV